MADRLWEHEPLDEYELEELTEDILVKAVKNLDEIARTLPNSFER